jgi:hypothetical protein
MESIIKFGITVTPAMQSVFEAADSTPIDWALTLAQEGLTTRALARPFVVIWAGNKYGVPVVEGQRGLTVAKNSAAEQAVKRVLAAVFSAEDTPKAPKSSPSVEIARGIKTAMKPVLAQFTKAEIQAYLRTL